MKKEQYDKILERLIISLQGHDVNSKEYSDILDKINKCVDVSQSFDRLDLEKMKVLKNLNREKKAAMLDIGVKVLGIGVGAFVQLWGVSNVLNFETEHVFSSKLGSPLCNLFFKRG